MTDNRILSLLDSPESQEKNYTQILTIERNALSSNNAHTCESNRNESVNTDKKTEDTEQYWNYEEEKHYLTNDWTCANQELLLGILKIIEGFREGEISLSELNYHKESYFSRLNLLHRFSKECKQGKDDDLIDTFHWDEISNQDLVKSTLSKISHGILRDVCEFLDSHMPEYSEWKARKVAEIDISRNQLS